MIKDIARGFLIGIANIIPGVSGGTLALLLGIYDKLIDIVSSLGIEQTTSFFKQHGKRSFTVLFGDDNFQFVLKIMTGAIAAIVVFSFIIEYLLINYPIFTLSFFLGMIMASIKVPYSMVRVKSVSNLIMIIPGIMLILAVYVFVAKIRIASDYSYVYVFLTGALAISAMILPGLSGSFIILVLGLYGKVISSIKSLTLGLSMDSIVFLAVFSAGCVTGLLLFTRIMKYFLRKYRDKTLFFLIGLVAGSAVVLWPFKEYPVNIAENLKVSITGSANILPSSAGVFGVAVILFLAGTGFSILVDKLAKK